MPIPRPVLAAASLHSEAAAAAAPSSARTRAFDDELPPVLARALAPFQRDGVAFILERGGRALLADEMGDAPMVVLAFSTGGPGEAMSVLPGIQNMLLAARALGIGSVLTTLHPQVMERVYALFEVPPDITFHHCIPLGYPRGNFGPTSRYRSADTTHWNTWDTPVPWT